VIRLICKIRSVKETDIPIVLKIEEHSYSDPWNFECFIMILNQTYYFDKIEKTFFYVLEENEKIIGYIIWEAGQINDAPKTNYSHLLSLTILESRRNMGYGKSLLIFAFNEMRKTAVNFCFLEVRESNAIAIRLYESMGMRVQHREPKYYVNEDALIYLISF
jgi:ribosomal-protein-alanine N-acetyltransferase